MKVHELVTGGPNPNRDEWDAYLQLPAFRGMRQPQVIWRSCDNEPNARDESIAHMHEQRQKSSTVGKRHLHSHLACRALQNVLPAWWPLEGVWRVRLGGISMSEFGNLRTPIMTT